MDVICASPNHSLHKNKRLLAAYRKYDPDYVHLNEGKPDVLGGSTVYSYFW